MYKKFKFFTFFSIITLIFFEEGTGQEKEHEHPVIIKIIPQTKENIGQFTQNDLSTNTSQGDYLDEFGKGKYFLYGETETLDEPTKVSVLPLKGEASPHSSPEFPESKHYHDLLKELGQYRKENINNSNPLIVRLVLHTHKRKEENPVFLDYGVFISGEKEYRLTKKGGREPVDMNHLFCTEVIKFIPNYNIKGILVNEDIDQENASADFKSVIACRKDITRTTDKIVKEVFNKFTKEIEEKLKQEIKVKDEDSMKEKLSPYIYGGAIYGVLPFKEKYFPITLSSLYNSPSLTVEHFKTVVRRILDLNLERGNKHNTTFTVTSPETALFNVFSRYLIKDENLEKFCLNLFGRNPLDEDGQDGCFQSAFSYYFSDSEQAFLKWLDDKHQKSTATFSSNVDDGEKEVDIVNKLDVILISYFDMCPACRGTISYLSSKTETDSQLSWFHRRIVHLLQTEISERGLPLKCDLTEHEINTFCVSLAKCNKGALS